MGQTNNAAKTRVGVARSLISTCNDPAPQPTRIVVVRGGTQLDEQRGENQGQRSQQLYEHV
ncbi:MAG: hypothetical protein AAB402_04465, partial [Patescibacteria group bacterium]